MHDTRRAGRGERRPAPAAPAAAVVGLRSSTASPAAAVASATSAATTLSQVVATFSTLIRRARVSIAVGATAAEEPKAPGSTKDLSASLARECAGAGHARIGVEITAGAADATAFKRAECGRSAPASSAADHHERGGAITHTRGTTAPATV